MEPLRSQGLSAMQESLPGTAYRSPEVFEREREAIFAREWLCAAREQDVAAPGDFVEVDALGESVLVVRTKAGALRGFYNVCRHRGCRLWLGDAVQTAPSPAGDPPGCGGPTGRFINNIRCPYHSWTYSFEGELKSAPFLEEGDGPARADLGLYPVAVDSWGGFVFVHLSPEVAASPGGSLHEQLGPISARVARYPLTDLRRAGRIEYEVNANWKVLAENYNECYHCGPVHPELCEIVPAFKKQGGLGLDWSEGVPHREGAWTFTRAGVTNRAPFPGLSDQERRRHKGELIYPNLMVSLSADHVAAFVLVPRSPGLTTVVCDFLFHPTEMEKGDFDPSDAIDFWDLVNRQDWAICEGVQKGMGSRRFASGYFAPMEDLSADIRRYVGDRLGDLRARAGDDESERTGEE